MNKNKLAKITMHAILTLFLLFLTGSAVMFPADAAQADSENTADETITFRILATGDLHGQVTPMNYETGEEDPSVGLSKIATLISKERKAVGTNNTFLLDAGDCLYDYSTDYIYENYPEETQPIYQAMMALRYDCITLGNHDFDYPWEYLYGQLESSGLLSKTLVCNAVYTESGESPFRTSAIYTKKAVTSDGRKVSLKIGVIGATKASLSSRRYRYSGFIDGLDIYTQVKSEVASLKKQGADIIVVFIHGGVGLLSGSDTTIQAGSRIAKLADVDAVICSHSHETFPSNNSTYSNIANVDEAAGTVYGTPVVETGSHAQGLGVIELTLSVGADGSISVVNGTSTVKSVRASTKEDENIADFFSEYQQRILDSHDLTEYPVKDGLVYTNADCIIQDSDLYQLMNEAKMRYASNYIATYAPDYSSYPIIAATVNYLDNKEQTIELSGSLTERDIAALIGQSSSERSSGYIHLYQISGANLLEWLEYSASIYGTAGTSLPELLASYAKKNPSISSLTRSSSVKDWSTYFAFDGISYDIDLSIAPRYNANGILINYTHRIQNLTCQGKAVTPDMNFVIVMDSVMTRYKFMPTDSDTIFTTWTWTTSKDVLMDYIKDQSIFGPLSVTADNNWHFIVPEDYKFVAAVPKIHDTYIKAQSWYQSLAFKGSVYYYYQGQLKDKTQSLHTVLSAGITEPTSRQIPVSVLTCTAPDATITEILYLAGNVQNVNSSRWEKDGKTVTGQVFNAKKNGRYSVRVTDSRGQITIAHITINNYDTAALEVPKVNTMTNRIEYVSGTAIAGSTIYIALPDGTLVTGKTDSEGAFRIEVPLPRAYDLYTIWAVKGKRTSVPLETTVKKTGANRPSADPLTEGAVVITGTADPYVTLSVRLGSTVYVAKGEKAAYKKSSVYKSSHKLVETAITQEEDGTFTILLPKAAVSGSTYYLYATDRNGNASRIVYIPVQ